MFPFDLNQNNHFVEVEENEHGIPNHCKKPKPNPNPVIIEPLITQKIYDICRAQDCLESVARAAADVKIDDEHIEKGEVILVPKGAGSVVIDDFELARIKVVDKKQSPLKKGFLDVEVEFVFEYKLIFLDCKKDVIIRVKAFSIITKKHTLFGSINSGSTKYTDMFTHSGETLISKAEPYVAGEARGVALKAEFRCNHCDRIPVDVYITIGMFSVIKLVRIVDLNVESSGFVIPPECENHDTDLCDFFNSAEFPMDEFSPLQRPEFEAMQKQSTLF